MSTITKFNISRENFPEFFSTTEDTGLVSTDPHEFTHSLEISDTVVYYKLSRKKMGDEAEDVTLYNIELDIDLIRSHNLFVDQSYFTIEKQIGANTQSTELFKPVDSVRSTINGAQLLSIFDKTYAVRPRPLIIPADQSDKKYLFPLRIFVPNTAATFNDCTFHVLTTSESTKEINTEDNTVPVINTDIWNITADSSHTVINSATSYKTFLAPITSTTTVTSPAVGDVIPVTVTCADTSVSKLYLDQVVGVLDKTQVELTNGVGNFSILTNTLSSGETVKVKIGYKKYTSVDIFTKTLA